MNRFMGKLLKSEAFDDFLLKEGMLRTGMEYRFGGKILPDYYDTEEREKLTEGYVSWRELRPFVYDLVKGKRTPLAFSFTLLRTKGETAEILCRHSIDIGEDSPLLFLQIRFEQGTGRIITGTARNTFTLDKSMEEAWDKEVKMFLRNLELACEEE